VKLTPRQLEIALLVADGLSAKEIAARLDLSLEPWKLIATTSTKRFGVNSAVLLVRWLIREGLLEP
jgi:DNA-binding CsgD family transcriptional regulator